MLKPEIRKLISERKRQHTNDELMASSLAINNTVVSHPRIINANTILLYYSMKGEVGTHELVEKLYNEGKTVLLPRVKNSSGIMDLVVYTGKECLKPAGSFHILEPQGKTFEEFDKIEVAIIPGVAFTKDGKRLGRGGGYYDRLLPKLANAYKVGVCFPFQLLDDIPTDIYDIRMDEVIS